MQEAVNNKTNKMSRNNKANKMSSSEHCCSPKMKKRQRKRLTKRSRNRKKNCGTSVKVHSLTVTTHWHLIWKNRCQTTCREKKIKSRHRRMSGFACIVITLPVSLSNGRKSLSTMWT
jgi:hypothetical protein